MREILINTWVVGGIAMATLATTATVAVTAGDPEWFARGGSITTVLGLLLLVKHQVLCAGADLESAMIEKLHYRRRTVVPIAGTEHYKAEIKHVRRILMDEFLGFGLTLVGTVIWGFGDLLLGLVL